jgi:DNA-binding transcriptional MerR regulator
MASLKDLLGDAYKEGMTLDEINTALASKNFVDPEALPKSVSKEVFDKTASELASVKKKLKELQEQNMSAEELLNLEKQRTEEMKKQYAKELAKLKAKEIFVESGLKEKEYTSLLEVIVTENEEVTAARARTIIDVINAQKKAVEQAVKAELLKDTPKPPAGDPGGLITKEQFDKMSSKEQMEFIQKNPNWKEILNIEL